VYMYPVSQEYKEAVYAPTRTVKAKVTFDISDVTAKDDVSNLATTTEATGISDKDQLINGQREQSFNLATWEPNRFKLDGNFSFPDDVLANNGEMGFVSENLCDVEGSFAEYPNLTFEFTNPHSSVGITVIFDTLNEEYATEFNLAVYDGSNNLIASIDVENNDKVQCDVNYLLSNYKKVVVTIKKWSVGERRARIVEIDFGLVKVYDDNNLIKCSLIEELDLTGSQLPSAEFKFTVDNADRAFNILNPTGFYAYLQQRQQVDVQLGVLTDAAYEWVPLGNYLLWEWTSDEGSLIATFTARTNLDLMSAVDYENLTAKTGYSLYQMAMDIFALCGISNYEIDTALQNVSTKALVKKTTCRNVLQMIALAGCANIFVTRDNVIKLVINPDVIGSQVDDIDMDNMYEEPKIELEPEVQAVQVTYYTDLDTSAEVTVNNPNVDSGEVLKLEGNTLINTSVQATNVANWLIRQRSYRAKYSINWRGNPAHELNDVITIETTYGTAKKAIITKNSIEYQGYLSVKTEARGGTS
jgi:hypothetical protein